VKVLAQHHAELDAVDADGNTALIEAASQGYLGAVRELLQAGANAQIRDHRGRGPLDVAAAHGRSRLVALLSSHAGPQEEQLVEGWGQDSPGATSWASPSSQEALEEEPGVTPQAGHRDRGPLDMASLWQTSRPPAPCQPPSEQSTALPPCDEPLSGSPSGSPSRSPSRSPSGRGTQRRCRRQASSAPSSYERRSFISRVRHTLFTPRATSGAASNREGAHDADEEVEDIAPPGPGTGPGIMAAAPSSTEREANYTNKARFLAQQRSVLGPPASSACPVLGPPA